MRSNAARLVALVITAVSALYSVSAFAAGGASSGKDKVVVKKPASGQLETASDRIEAVLKALLFRASSEQIDAIIKTFKIPATGTLAEKKAALSKYLGLLRDIRDMRRAYEVVVKDVFVSPDLKKNFVVYADAGVHIRSRKDPASGLITLYGDRGSLYIKFKKQLVSARLIRMDLSRREVFGEGDAMMRDEERVIVGEKFYFNSETQHGIIYNANTYIRPYFYFGESIKKIGEHNYVLEEGWFTTCDDEKPHYKFSASRCWIYQDVRLLAYDVTYKVSDFPVLWLPFIFHPMEGTGLWVGLGRDTRVGWFMQLVNLGPFLNLPFELNLDFYQRLGVAVLAKKTLKWNNWSSTIGLGLALDKPLGLVNNVWQNTVDGDRIPGNESGSYGDWKRELRWDVDLTHAMTIPHDSSNPKTGSSSLSFKFNLMSDPYFKSDFDTKHIKVIQLEKIFRQEEVSFFNQGSLHARKWNFRLSDKRGGSSLSLSGDWNFLPYRNPETRNLYANDYYIYRKRSITLPDISYSFSGNFLSSAPLPAVNTNANRSLTNAHGELTNTLVTATSKSSKKAAPDILDTSDDRAGSRARQKISYSLGYSAGISFNVLKEYSDIDESLVQKRLYRALKLAIPASFKAGSSFSSSLNVSINDTDQWGETTTSNQLQANESATITTLDERASLSLAHTFNKGLLSEVGGAFALDHSLAVRISDAPDVVDIYNAVRSHSISMSVSLNFFKTKISAGTSYDMTVLKEETRNQGRDRFSDLSVRFFFNPFTFMTISDSFSYAIRTDQAIYNTLSVNLKAPSFRLPFVHKFTGVAAHISWYHSYMDHRASKLTFSLSMRIEINKLWTLTLSLSSLNKELYLYSGDYAAEFGKESRSFLKDLLYSLMVWDADKLRESPFNLNSFRLKLSHDLHEWWLNFTATMSQQVNTIGRRFSYFDFSFLLSISMKTDIGITFPDHRYRYTADSSGNYHGKYN